MDRTQGHWAKFSDAIRDIGAAAPAKGFSHFYEIVSNLMLVAQRFYLPDACNVLEGRKFDDGLRPLLRLPYDCIALLSETTMDDNQAAWKITLSFDPDGATNNRLSIMEPSHFQPGALPLISIVRYPGYGWFLTPVMCCMMPRADVGYDFAIATFGNGNAEIFAKWFNEKSGRSVSTEFIDDSVSLTNLCAILSLSNATTKQVTAPAALNRMRARKGKKPLYDYHVLVVDGETWDSPHVTTNTGNGVRSHLRRGHIRRLDDTRRVWVRATYVHGSVPGFVDKDYKVESHPDR